MISCSEEPLAGSKNKHRLEAISSFAKRWIQLHYVFLAMVSHLLSIIVLKGQKIKNQTL